MVDITIAGNEVWRWLLFGVVLLVSLILGRLIRYSMTRISERISDEQRRWLAVLLKGLSRSVILLCVAVVAFLIVRCGLLKLPDILVSAVTTATRVLLAAAIGYVVYCLVDVIDYYLNRFAGRTQSKVDDMLVPLVGKSVRVTVLVLVVLQVAQELSTKPVTSIIAGLGVGGLAIALAGQDTIKNFFGSLVIIGDRPFEIGDRIVVDGQDGPVESVGFRSTKLRTLTGHLVTVPNAEMVNKTIQNIGKRPYIKHVANITITYDTPPDKVDEAISIIEAILHNHEGMSEELPPRVFFSAFNDWSLNIMVLFWYHPPDYWQYMAYVTRFNRELLHRFNAAGIEFAFPTQTIQLERAEPTTHTHARGG